MNATRNPVVAAVADASDEMMALDEASPNPAPVTTTAEDAQEVAAVRAPVAVATSDAERAALMRFYGVDTPDALIAAQADHIEKLQSKLQPAPSFAPQRVREG